MTSRQTLGTVLVRAARGAVQEGSPAALDISRVLRREGPSSGDGAYGSGSTGSSGSSGSSVGSRNWTTPQRPALAALALPVRGAAAAAAATTSPLGAAFRSFAASAAAPDAAEAAAESPAPAPASAAADADAATQARAEAEAALLSLRSQLADSLAVCLGMQQLDALLARPENRAAVDEMLLLSALDVAYRLCASVSAALPPPPIASALAAGAAASSSSSSSSSPSAPSAAVKSSAEAASDALTRLSELLIQRLSEPGALSAEGAVRALRTLAMLRFNPAGDYAGLQTMAAFYREAVLPQLDPERLPPDAAARTPQLLADLFYAFSRLFEVAARREKELQTQLLAAQIAEEEAAASREDAGGGGGAADTTLPPWQRSGAGAGAGGGGGGGGGGGEGGGPYPPMEGLVVLGDRQLYSQLCKMLSTPGMLANVPSKTLGTLATAMATARYTHFPLAQSIATQTLLRLQGAGLAAAGGGGGQGSAGTTAASAAAAAAAAGVRLEGQLIANDAMATSTLSNILSCLAKLGYEHEALCDAVANWMLQRLQGGGQGQGGAGAGAGAGGGPRVGGTAGIEPHHVVDVAVAFVRIKYENMDFLLRASEVLQFKLPQANPHSVAMMTWAIANSKSGRFPEFDGVLSALAQRMVALHRYNLAATTAASGGAGTGTGTGAKPKPKPIPGGPGLAVLPRHLTCMVFALAKLGHKHARLMDATAADVVSRPDKYQARQLVSVLRAFTLLNDYVPDMYDTACAVLTSRLRALDGQSAAALAAAPPAVEFVLTAQHYADAAWAVAMAGHAHRAPELMELLAGRIAEVAPQLGKACVVRAAQAYAVAGISDPRLMEALAQASRPLLVDLGPDYLAALVGAFAEGQQPVSEEFWLACMDAVGLKIPHMERPRPDMQAATARLADAFRRHRATAAYPACAQHYVLPLLEGLVESQQLMLQQQ